MTRVENPIPTRFSRGQLEHLDRAALVQLVLVLLDNDAALREKVRQLEARLKTNSGNSSKPPSTDSPKSKAELKRARQKLRRRRKKHHRKRGGQPGHEGHFRAKVPPEEVDQWDRVLPSACFHCGGRIDESCVDPGIRPASQQTYELVEKPIRVTEHVRPACRCKRCGGVSQAPLEPEIRLSVLEPRLAGASLFLRGVLQGSTRDVVEFFTTVFKTPVSLGTVSNVEDRFTEASEQSYQEILEFARKAAVLNIDETTWYEKSDRRVLWIATNAELSVYRIDRSKGRDALHKLIGENFQGIAGSDRAKAYDGIPPERRQVCWSHLDRNYQKLSDAGGEGRRIAKMALAEIDTLFAIWHEHKRGELDHGELAEKLGPVKDGFRKMLNLGMKKSDSAVQGICKGLDKTWDALWTFTKHRGVEPTNNSAERQGRPAVTLRKTSLGSQSDRGSRFVERMLTTVQTLKKQGRQVFEHLVEVVRAYRSGRPAPSLLPLTPDG